MLPRRETTSRWADICLYTGSERSEVDCLSTTDRGSLRQPGICWYASANLCQEVLVDIQELLITYGSAQKIQVPKSLTCLLCERSSHSSHTRFSSMLWYWTSWKLNWVCLFYTLLLPTEPSSSWNVSIAFWESIVW